MHSIHAKAILFCLTNEEELLPKVIESVALMLGPLDHQSKWHPFPKGHYYEEEMGPSLKRCLLSFEKNFDPTALVSLKKETTKIEKKFSKDGKRKINIDPGYVDFCKVVLASWKKGGLKIALNDGVFAHLALRYEKGGWLPLPSTFPDFLAPTYHQDLLTIRKKLKGER